MDLLDAGGSAEVVGAVTPSYHNELGRVLSRLDLLMLLLRLDDRHDGRDIVDDLMMVELITLLPIIQMARALPAMLDATMEDDNPLPPSLPTRSCGSLHLGVGHVSRDVVEDLMVVELVALLHVI